MSLADRLAQPRPQIVWRNDPQPGRQVKSYLDLCVAMQRREPVTLTGTASDGRVVTTFSGLVNRIEAEDGSGHNWNVTVNDLATHAVTVLFLRLY